ADLSVLPEISPLVVARLARSFAHDGFAGQLWKTTAARRPLVPCCFPFAFALRPGWFAWTIVCGPVADLLRRTVVSPSDLVLERAMEAGRLAERVHFSRRIWADALARNKTRLLMCRGIQSPPGCGLRRNFAKMAEEFAE